MISSAGIGAKRWVIDPESAATVADVREIGAPPISGADFCVTMARSSANEAVDHLKAAACAFDRSLSQAIRQQPYRSVVIAAGAGILAGILLKRPRSSR